MVKHPDLNDAENIDADTTLAAWTAVLDTLEAAANAAEAVLQDPLGYLSARQNSPASNPPKHWLPPAHTTPLPPELVARADALVAEQESLAKRLEQARLNTARQLQAVASVPGIGEPPAAVYLDVKG